jgi:hypothetical protein
MGLCPSGSRVGDLVVVLYGGSVPYLLRLSLSERDRGNGDCYGSNCGDYYFVGECYAEGLMAGEACALPGDLKSEEVFFLV